MTLSTSRQQFLAYESQAAEDISYSRRGVVLSTCVCIGLVIFAVVLAALVGVIVYFITYYKLSQSPGDFWDEMQPFAQGGPPSPDLRLPSDIVPSFYRLKITADLDNSNYTGEVYITIKTSKKAKEIVLHSKNLTINKNAILTEQIYEKVETLHMRRRRDVPDIQENNVTKIENESVVTNEQNVITNQTAVVPNAVETTVAPIELREATAQNESLSVDTVIKNNSNDTVDKVQNITANVEVPSTTEAIVEKDTSSNTDTNAQVTHSSVRNIKILSITEAAGDRLILTLATALKPNVDYILEIPFEGQISNSLMGFYKSSYTNANKEEKSLAVTQFEPTSARAAFPCFDEPGFKAKFEISIAHRNNMTVLSNMKISSKEAIAEKPGWEWTHFERSVRMSTYLVAYILCDFISLETSYVSKDNVTKPIKVWTRPELIKNAEYAVSITPKLLEFYEEVFGVPYALDKLDMVAIPDFSSGAMENWGLITFRETTLLFDEATGAPRDKQNVAIDIAHELAHQWFGNLVTMQWWTDLWLNEGFATYIEYVGVDHIEPSWNMFEAFSRDMLELLRSDALKNTSPVSRKVVHASEISQKFDEISYSKGANLIRMLNNTMTEELFHKGLVNYLNKWKYANAEENDLWSAMWDAVSQQPEFAGRSLVRFMNSWTRQPGYPLLRVKRNYDTGAVHFEQELFTSSKDPYKSMQEQLWEIPINYINVDAPVSEWSTKPKLWLSEKTTEATLPVNASQALYVNIGATGYYRVNYDQKNWELLSTALQSGQIKSPVTKSQLIDDSFNLAKSGQLAYSYALGLTTCVRHGEDSRMVWDLLLNNMAFLNYNLKTSSGYVYFQDYMKILLKKQLEVLNYGLVRPSDHNQALLAESLVMWECMVEAPRCLDWAKAQFNSWMEAPDHKDNPIPSYLRSLVYNMALKYGGRREFEFLWKVFQESTDPNVKTLIITNLPSTREEALITMLLEKSLTEIPKQYAVAAWSVEPPLGTRLAQQFLLRNFQQVYDTFTSLDAVMFSSVLNGAFGLISSEDELDMLKSFAIEHKQQLVPMSQALQKLVDTARLRIAWLQAYAPTITGWLRDYVHDANNSTKTENPSPPETKPLPNDAPVHPDTRTVDNTEVQPDAGTAQLNPTVKPQVVVPNETVENANVPPSNDKNATNASL